MSYVQIPPSFTNYIQEQIGPTLTAELIEALNTEPSVSVRLNPWKTSLADSEIITNCELQESKIPWCQEGYYLKERPNFTLDPQLHAGAYYVQESSSMFISHAVRQLIHEPISMLDLCAAPGGKTTALLSSLPEGSTLISNEVVPKRAAILAENVFKWTGFIDKPSVEVMVTNNQAQHFQQSGMLFDAILADVPCSGEGMMRKDMEARRQWSPALVEQCAALQREIVAAVWPCLRPGGLLFYSTCTFNTHEDEDNLSWIARELGAEPVYIKVEAEWGIHPEVKGELPAYRFIPGHTKGEGLFMAVLRKTDDDSQKDCTPTFGHDKQKKNQKPKQGTPLHFLTDPRLVLPQQSTNFANSGAARNKVSLSSSELCIPLCELPKATAINYLAREAIVLPDGTPQGLVLVSYKGLPLGYVKNIGQRANNLYPKEWRIRNK